MAYSLRAVSIVVALGVSVVFVSVAFFISDPGSANEVSAEDTEEALKAYAARDTDVDGLPDWQEALYGTDPNDASSVQEGINDGDAVAAGLVKPKFQSEDIPEPIDPSSIPGTPPAPLSLTEKFSRVFLESYMNASGGQPMSAADQQALVSFLLKDFSAKASTVLQSTYTLSALRQTAETDVLIYAAAVEQVLLAYQATPGAGSPITLAQDFIENGNDRAASQLQSLSRVYRNRTDALLRVAVPSRFAAEHLQLVRAFDTLAKSTTAIADYKDDPLPVLGALALYQPASKDLLAAYRSIASEIRLHGEQTQGEPGAIIVNIVDQAN